MLSISINRLLFILLSLLVVISPVQGLFQVGSEITYGIKYALILLMWGLACFGQRIALMSFPVVYWGLVFLAVSSFLWGVIAVYLQDSELLAYLEVFLLSLVLSLSPLVMMVCLPKKHDEQYTRSLVLYLISSMTFSLAICWAYSIFGTEWLVPEAFRDSSFRLHGAIKSPNATAYVSFGLILMVMLAAARNWLSARFVLPLFLLGFTSLFATISKASIIASIPALLIMSWGSKKYIPRKIRKTLRLSLILGFVIVTVLAAYMIFVSGSDKRLVWNHFNPDNPVLAILRIKPEIETTGNRQNVWKISQQIFIDHWWVGIGIPNWKVVLDEYGVPGFDSPHNGLIEVSGGLGFFGAIAYITLLFGLFIIGSHLDTVEKKIMYALLIFTYVRELVEVSSVFSYVINGLIFWLMVGLLIVSGMSRRSGFEVARLSRTHNLKIT